MQDDEERWGKEDDKGGRKEERKGVKERKKEAKESGERRKRSKEGKERKEGRGGRKRRGSRGKGTRQSRRVCGTKSPCQGCLPQTRQRSRSQRGQRMRGGPSSGPRQAATKVQSCELPGGGGGCEWKIVHGTRCMLETDEGGRKWESEPPSNSGCSCGFAGIKKKGAEEWRRRIRRRRIKVGKKRKRKKESSRIGRLLAGARWEWIHRTGVAQVWSVGSATITFCIARWSILSKASAPSNSLT